MKLIWITWEHQPRNWETAKGLGAKYFEFNLGHVPYYKKYIVGPIRTLKTIWREKPDVVFCENPSFMLAITVVIFKRLLRYKAVVDTHNGGLLLNRGYILRSVGKFLRRFADITIVSNLHLTNVVKDSGGTPFVLPDCIPNIQPGPQQEGTSCRVFYVCSYAGDEPYANVFKAAKLLPHVEILLSGNHEKKQILKCFDIPENVTLLGYLPRDQYEQHLQSADVIMALTTRQDCLLCGNYEAVAVEKPLVTTSTSVISTHFRVGTVYCNNTPNDIAVSIMTALRNRELLSRQMKQLKAYRTREWNYLAKNLLAAVNG